MSASNNPNNPNNSNNSFNNTSTNANNFNNAARAASAASKAQTATIYSAYLQRYNDYNTSDDILYKQFRSDEAKTTAFLQSVKITLNKNSNTNKEIIQQYGILKSFNDGYAAMQKSNLDQRNNVGKTLKGIDSLTAEINATINSTNNTKKVSDIGKTQLNSLLAMIAEVRTTDYNTLKSYNKLNTITLPTQYNDIYNTLRNQIKNALIGYYTKMINDQIVANTYNANFNSVGKANTNSDKVAILISIKAKLDNLDTIFNTDVAEYMDQIIEPPNNKGAKIGNNEISAFQNDIQQKINAQSQVLNSMIQDIRNVTKKDIEDLKTSVADLVTQITNKINAFKGIHSTYFNQSSTDAIAKLTEVGISLNVPFSTSNTTQNNQMTAIIRKLAETATKVGNETIPDQVSQNAPSQNAQQVNATALTGNIRNNSSLLPSIPADFPDGLHVGWTTDKGVKMNAFVNGNKMVRGSNKQLRIPLKGVRANGLLQNPAQINPSVTTLTAMNNGINFDPSKNIPNSKNKKSGQVNVKVNNSPRNSTNSTNFNQPSI